MNQGQTTAAVRQSEAALVDASRAQLEQAKATMSTEQK